MIAVVRVRRRAERVVVVSILALGWFGVWVGERLVAGVDVVW
jgi:uncharacterized membrane protein YsdA (DUF1294 family)